MVEFDELTYLELNPDVENAVLTGVFASGYEHWSKCGQAEGRLAKRPPAPPGAPPEWNEAKYLRANPDVAAAVRAGSLSSGYVHWQSYGRHEGRSGTLLRYDKQSAEHLIKTVPVGFNSFGYQTVDNGLGNAIRGYSDVFRRLTGKLRATDVPLWGASSIQRAGFDRSRSPYAINFIHQNPDVLPLFLSHFGLETLVGRINIAYWVWEMHAGYPAWRHLSKLFHQIWVPSRYVALSLQSVSASPIAIVPHVVDSLPETPSITRATLGLPENAFVFLYVFDIASTLGRKNPLALLRSFRNVFRNNKNVVLLLKYQNPTSEPTGAAALERLAAPCTNVKLLNQTMPIDQVYSLFQVADCFVSPHRSEGFGLNIATAMYYGKPVIATGYSGNMDYMDDSTAFPIDYDVVQAGPGHHHYREGYGWAEPSTEHLEELLMRVYGNRDLAARIGAAGKKVVREQLNVEAVAQIVRNRLQEITGGLLPGDLS